MSTTITAYHAALPEGTPVLMVGQTDARPAPLHWCDEAIRGVGIVRVGTFVQFETTADRVAPAADATPETLAATDARVECRKHAEAPYAWQRRQWLARLDGAFVGTYATKREAMAAIGVAAGIFRWHAERGTGGVRADLITPGEFFATH